MTKPSRLRQNWKLVVIIVLPVLLLPLLFAHTATVTEEVEPGHDVVRRFGIIFKNVKINRYFCFWCF